jgi:hypothetical protein
MTVIVARNPINGEKLANFPVFCDYKFPAFSWSNEILPLNPGYAQVRVRLCAVMESLYGQIWVRIAEAASEEQMRIEEGGLQMEFPLLLRPRRVGQHLLGVLVA